jgi:hypothetical protein
MYSMDQDNDCDELVAVLYCILIKWIMIIENAEVLKRPPPHNAATVSNHYLHYTADAGTAWGYQAASILTNPCKAAQRESYALLGSGNPALYLTVAHCPGMVLCC